MKLRTLALVAVASLLPQQASAQTWPGELTNKTNRFNLPIRRDADGRQASMLGNGVTVSWDGKLVMYQDDQWQSPFGAWNTSWYAFASFDAALATVSPTTGAVDFTACFGAPLPRFAHVDNHIPPGTTTNTYPTAPQYSGGGYPEVPWTMGQLGLLSAWDVLSHNMHPAPVNELPAGASNANPFRSTHAGVPQIDGPCLTYHAYITFQDQPRYWAAGPARWRSYTGGVFGTSDLERTCYWGTGAGLMYPNGTRMWSANSIMKRNGVAKLEIIVDLSVDTPTPPVHAVNVLQKWKPFQVQFTQNGDPSLKIGLDIPAADRMWADNFEPSLTNDGHLMIGKGARKIAGGTLHSHVMFYYNNTAFSDTGWQGPWDLHYLYSHRNVVLGGRTIEERYPISRQPLKSYDGSLFADTDGNGTVTASELEEWGFEGGYNWISPDGRYVVYTTYGGGVGSAGTLGTTTWPDHPQTVDPGFLVDGGGSSNRAQTTVVGSVTGWQQWRIDNPAANAGRHLFTAWDQESRTTYLRTGSFGFSPGFWNMLMQAPGLPFVRDGLPKLHLVNSNQLLFYEVDLSPYQERDYGFYLPMTELLTLEHDPWATYQNWNLPWIYPAEHREVDILRTPDLSGNANVGHVSGAQLPCEYFKLPQRINGLTNTGDKYVPGLYKPVSAASAAAAAAMIFPGPGTPPASSVVQVGTTGWFWAKLADWKDGTPVSPPPSTSPRTTPYTGRGNDWDMDSDVCWGRVGQAMFFKDNAKVVVHNNGTKPELNPGTLNRANGMTASFWIHPLQARLADVFAYRHNFFVALKQSGQIAAALYDAGGNISLIDSGAGTAPLAQWTHVALTWRDTPAASQSEVKLYLNGVLAGGPVTIANDRLYPSTYDVDIGCLGAVATDSSKAVFLLDEVTLKNSALEPEDVRHLALLPAMSAPVWNNSNLPTPPAPFNPDNSEARVPASNPFSAGRAMLGADLFRDVQLSGQKRVSCATCHKPELRFTDGQVKSLGQSGLTLRHTPSILNQRFEIRQFWDARADNLEDQALDPVLSSGEMANTWPSVLTYLSGDPDYSPRFQAQFPGPNPITEENVRKALATYMRSPTTGNSPADQDQLSTAQRNGRGLFFGKARCSGCHDGKNLTDGRLWNTGTVRSNGADDGASRADAGRLTAERKRYFGAFKTPSLRDVAQTAPYFHDGHASSLAQVVAFYNAGGVRTDGNGFTLQQAGHHFAAEEINRKLGLTAQEEADLVAYLGSLTGTSLSLGPAGLNNAPTVSVLPAIDGTMGPPAVTIDVTDPDLNDIDPAMNWTLEVLFTGNPVPVGWNGGTVTTIPGGRRITITTPVPSGTVRAADHHGKWSATVGF